METLLHTLDVIAGPCSAESREQVLETAKGLKKIGIKTLRAGLWKPRSRCGTFEGMGAKALPWLKEVQSELGMKVMTEVALPYDCIGNVGKDEIHTPNLDELRKTV